MRRIVLSRRSSNKLSKLLEYLENEWSLKARNDFLKRLNKSLSQIQNFPESSSETDYVKGLRMLVITKQTSIFYRFNSKTITVVTLFDNRMNPTGILKKTK
ncbi:MAG: type II toxin-antitoxin system RelE/ParE family toxin [Bacteroidetes bacterium]|nr:type II toxin-antitoxin system RelE/ParE family toxin [Bacteroidota bacterium]